MDQHAAALAAALAGARLGEATAVWLQQLLPGIDVLRLAVPATAEVLLLTSNLLAPGHLTLALQPRARTLAGEALERAEYAFAALEPTLPVWQDLDIRPLPGFALALPVVKPEPAPATVGAAALAASRPASALPVTLGAGVPTALASASALVLAASDVAVLSKLQATAALLGRALAAPLAAAAPRVVHQVAAFLTPHRCACGACAPASQRRAYQDPKAQSNWNDSAALATPSWSSGSCHDDHPGPPDSGAGSGSLSVASSGNDDLMSRSLEGAAPVSAAGRSTHDSVTSGRAVRAAAKAASTQLALGRGAGAAARRAGGPAGGDAASEVVPCSPGADPAPATGPSAASAREGSRGAGSPRGQQQEPPPPHGGLAAACGGGGGGGKLAQGWLLGFRDRALEHKYCVWNAAQKLQLDATAALIAVLMLSASGLLPPHFHFFRVFPAHLLIVLAQALPLLLIKRYPGWFMRNRERLHAALQLATAAYVVHLCFPCSARLLGAARCLSPTWFARFTYAEGLLVIPLCFRVRLRWLVALQAAAWAMAVHSLPTGACAAAVVGSWPGCVRAALAVQLCVGILPSLAVHYWTERGSRAAFVAAMQA